MSALKALGRGDRIIMGREVMLKHYSVDTAALTPAPSFMECKPLSNHPLLLITAGLVDVTRVSVLDDLQT